MWSKCKILYEWFAGIAWLMGFLGVLLLHPLSELILRFKWFSFSTGQIEDLIKWVSLGTIVHGGIVFYVNALFKNMRKVFDAAVKGIASRDVVNLLRRYEILADGLWADNSCYDVIGAVCDLLRLTMTYIHKGGVESFISETLKSPYYVYTMSASHNKDSLLQMRKYLSRMVEEIVIKRGYYSKKAVGVDASRYIERFALVVPYGRNVMLADAVASVFNEKSFLENGSPVGKVPLLLAQARSGSKLSEGDSAYETFYRHFFGCDELERYLERECSIMGVEKVKLHVIIVDCNVTQGETFTDVVDDFNSFIDKGIAFKCSAKVELSRVRDAATLFIASDKAFDKCSELSKEDSLKHRFQSRNVTLWFYFVLLESVKEKIVNKKNELNGKKWRDAAIIDFVRGNFKSETVKKWIKYKEKKFDGFIQTL